MKQAFDKWEQAVPEIISVYLSGDIPFMRTERSGTYCG